MSKTIILIGVVILVAALAVAQDATFTAGADRTKVAAGEQFQLTFTVSGPDANTARNFKPPDFLGFVVLSGPNSSTSIQIVNGRMSASMTYGYVMYARQEGKFSVGSATVEVKGKTFSSPAIVIEVAKPNSKAQKQPPSSTAETELGDNLFIRAVVDKNRVRQGEQLTVTHKLYTRLTVAGYELAKAPAFEGFWSEDFDQPRQPEQSVETVDGKQYRVALIRRTALFATQSGKLTIAPLEVRCAVQTRRRSNDPFDSFFNDPFFQQLQNVNYEVRSNPLAITVDPLPSGAPPSFSGAVGKYAFSVSVDKKEVKAGDPITMTITASGTGNVRLIGLPRPTLPADMEAYDPKVSEEIHRDRSPVTGKKMAEYLLIPRNAGQRVIEPMAFTYFDLDRKEYVTARSGRFEFTILPGKEIAPGTVLSSKEDIRLLGEDIRFVKLSPGTIEPVGRSPWSSFWILAGLVIPPVAFLGAFVARKRREALTGNMPRLLFEKAGREAAKRLKTARALLAKGNREQYHAEVARALFGYLEHKLQIPKASMSFEEASQRLRERGVPVTVVDRLSAIIERAEFARFAPEGDSQEARRDLLDTAAGAINDIDRSINGRKR